MANTFSDAELIAFLDEGLPPEAMARIETAARADSRLVERLAQLGARRDGGVHSLGEIWRRHRLTCPTREQWGSYLLGALDDQQVQYYTAHVEQIGCRLCQANLSDLRAEQASQPGPATARRQKYFQSSAGRLRSR